MKAENLIASIVAVLFTTASLSAVHYNVDARQAPNSEINGISVINLPAVQVHPAPAETSAVALRPAAGFASTTLVPTWSHMSSTGATEGLSLIGSQLAMPYYSFGKNFGRISKE